MMKINKIVIHCSDTPNGRPDTAEDVHKWHKENGWDGIGYHYVICVDGDVQKGRPNYWQGSHVRGHNSDSLGICLMGTDSFSKAQWNSLEGLVWSLTLDLGVGVNVVGHYNLDPKKTCPNFDVMAWWESKLRKRLD